MCVYNALVCVSISHTFPYAAIHKLIKTCHDKYLSPLVRCLKEPHRIIC